MEESSQKKKVVTCFIEYNEKILLFKRSNRVGTYKGKWAAVSGYIESGETPYQTALKELFEETQLPPDDVELIKKGKVLSVQNHVGTDTWIVHPFLFHVKIPNKIKIDWEHSTFKWIRPADIIAYDTVPKLRETLEQVREFAK